MPKDVLHCGIRYCVIQGHRNARMKLETVVDRWREDSTRRYTRQVQAPMWVHRHIDVPILNSEYLIMNVLTVDH
jgi:hypothetical protein